MALRRRYKFILWVLSLVSVLMLWYYVSELGIVSSLILPSPVRVAERIFISVSTGSLFTEIWISLARIVVGFTLAFLVALPLALLAGSNEIVQNILKPWVQLLQPIPGIAWVPFAFLLFGLSNNAAIFVIAVAAFFPIFINVMNGVQMFDRHLINVARSLGANRLQVIYKVLIPGIFPELVAGSRISIGFAWRAVVAAEMIGLPEGLGSMLIQAKNTAQTDIVIASMLILGIIMIFLEKIIFDTLDKEIARWKGTEEGD
ncbi:MAG: ABC transporter permease [Candidatus Micrarchaeia archaeon]